MLLNTPCSKQEHEPVQYIQEKCNGDRLRLTTNSYQITAVPPERNHTESTSHSVYAMCLRQWGTGELRERTMRIRRDSHDGYPPSLLAVQLSTSKSYGCPDATYLGSNTILPVRYCSSMVAGMVTSKFLGAHRNSEIHTHGAIRPLCVLARDIPCSNLGHIKSEKISLSASIRLGIGTLQEESLSSFFSDCLYPLQREK